MHDRTKSRVKDCNTTTFRSIKSAKKRYRTKTLWNLKMEPTLSKFETIVKILLCILLPITTTAFVSRSFPKEIANSASRPCAVKDATFGMGCFWEPAEEMLKVDGVVDTVAGYTGVPSASEAPNYDSVCFSRDWVEGVRVRYDDEKISYERLLDFFFASQKSKLGSRQYASIIFPHDEEQRKIATNYLQTNASRQNADGWATEWTAIEPLSRFFKAEGYHQNYWKKQRPRFAAIVALLAVATGLLDPIVPLSMQKAVETVANASVLAIGTYQLLERVVDTKVEEL